jgi:hypothetical protein
LYYVGSKIEYYMQFLVVVSFSSLSALICSLFLPDDYSVSCKVLAVLPSARPAMTLRRASSFSDEPGIFVLSLNQFLDLIAEAELNG